MTPAPENRYRTLKLVLDASVVFAALATIPLIVAMEAPSPPDWVHVADWVVWGVFMLEYAIEFWIHPQRAEYLRGNWVGAGVVILSFPLLPSVLGLVRLARLLRLVLLVGVTARAVQELRSVLVRRGLVYASLVTGFIVFAGGTILSILEPQTVKGGFFDGLWWAIVTASTVGYGDIAPSSVWGRLIAVILMLAGIGLMSTLAASITTYFVGKDESSELADLRERLDRIERKLDRLQDSGD